MNRSVGVAAVDIFAPDLKAEAERSPNEAPANTDLLCMCESTVLSLALILNEKALNLKS